MILHYTFHFTCFYYTVISEFVIIHLILNRDDFFIGIFIVIFSSDMRVFLQKSRRLCRMHGNRCVSHKRIYRQSSMLDTLLNFHRRDPAGFNRRGLLFNFGRMFMSQSECTRN